MSEITREDLQRMYIEKDMSILTIAFCKGVHQSKVSKLLTEFGIPKRKHGSIEFAWRNTVWSK